LAFRRKYWALFSNGDASSLPAVPLGESSKSRQHRSRLVGNNRAEEAEEQGRGKDDGILCGRKRIEWRAAGRNLEWKWFLLKSVK